jgi:hypothetical protein
MNGPNLIALGPCVSVELTHPRIVWTM